MKPKKLKKATKKSIENIKGFGHYFGFRLVESTNIGTPKHRHRYDKYVIHQMGGYHRECKCGKRKP